MTEQHKKDRYRSAKYWRKQPVEVFEQIFSSDEKIFTVDGYDNPYNDVVYETSSKNVPTRKV